VATFPISRHLPIANSAPLTSPLPAWRIPASEESFQWFNQISLVVWVVMVARLLPPASAGVALLALLAARVVEAPLWALLSRSVHRGPRWSLSLGVGLGLFGVLLFGVVARPVAWIVDSPALEVLLPLAALATGLNLIAAPPMALLVRDGSAAVLWRAHMAGAVAGMLFALVAAVRGGGPWSLVYASLVAAGVRLTLVWWSAPWSGSWLVRPSASSQVPGVARLAGRYADKTLVAAALGAPALAVYQMGLDVAGLPGLGLARWLAAPVFRGYRPAQGQLPWLAERACLLMRCVAALLFPLALILVVAAEPITAALLGSQWLAVAPVLRFAGVAMVALAFHRVSDMLLSALGYTQLLPWWSVAAGAAGVAAGALFLSWGVQGVAIAWVAVWAVLAAASTVTALCLADLPAARIAAVFGPPVLGIVGAAAACQFFIAFSWPPGLAVLPGLVVYAGLLRAVWPSMKADWNLVLHPKPAAPRKSPRPETGVAQPHPSAKAYNSAKTLSTSART
jgi:O-antigen/teichoic acid export membrane protein